MVVVVAAVVVPGAVAGMLEVVGTDGRYLLLWEDVAVAVGGVGAVNVACVASAVGAVDEVGEAGVVSGVGVVNVAGMDEVMVGEKLI